jgi:hypothetical protein
MMVVKYPRRYLKTRRQVTVQTFALALFLMPILAWRLPQERPAVGMALTMLTLAPFVVAVRGLRFLRVMEARHTAPTPEMMFLFEQVAVFPLAMSAFLWILLAEM